MKTVYPVIISKDKDGYTVHVPDLDIGTQGTDIADAIGLARDAIGLWGICEQDMGREIPPAGNLNPPCDAGDTLALIDIDFAAYRRANDHRTVRKNLTIPSWLNEMAIQSDINFSQVLQCSFGPHSPFFSLILGTAFLIDPSVGV